MIACLKIRKIFFQNKCHLILARNTLLVNRQTKKGVPKTRGPKTSLQANLAGAPRMSRFDIPLSNRDNVVAGALQRQGNGPLFRRRRDLSWIGTASAIVSPSRAGIQTPKQKLFYLLSRAPALSPTITTRRPNKRPSRFFSKSCLFSKSCRDHSGALFEKFPGDKVDLGLEPLKAPVEVETVVLQPGPYQTGSRLHKP